MNIDARPELLYDHQPSGGSIDYGTKVIGLGLPQAYHSQIEKFMDSRRANHNNPRSWRFNSIELVNDLSVDELEQYGIKSSKEAAWTDNAQLETRQDQVRQLEFTAHTPTHLEDKYGRIRIQIGPDKAVVSFENQNMTKGEPIGTTILENLSQGKVQIVQAVEKIKPQFITWIEEQNQSTINQRNLLNDPQNAIDRIIYYHLLENDTAFFNTIAMVALPKLKQSIKEYFLDKKNSPTDKAVVRALLTMWFKNGKNGQSADSFLKGFFSNPNSNFTSNILEAFQGSALEISNYEGAIRLLADLEKGDIKTPLLKLLKGERIKTQILEGSQRVERIFCLPTDIQNYITVNEQGEITIDLKRIGTKKLGLALGMITNALDQLQRATGRELHLHLERDEFVPVEKTKVDDGFNSSLSSLVGETSDTTQLSGVTRREQQKWVKNGYALTTLLGTTGSGKTTLARTQALEFAQQAAERAVSGRQDLKLPEPHDDVVIFKFTGTDPKELLKAQKSYLEILKGRQGKVTVLLIDDFQKMNFQNLDEQTNQALLEIGTQIHSLFANKEKDAYLGGVFHMGESEPPGIDQSYFGPHRYPKTQVDLAPQERLPSGLKAIKKHIQATTEEVSRQIEEESEASMPVDEQLKAAVAKNLGVICEDIVKANPALLRFLESEQGVFFNLARWNDAVGEKMSGLLLLHIRSLLTSTPSEWFDFDNSNVVFTKQGRREFTEKMNELLNGTIDTTRETAIAKMGVLSKEFEVTEVVHNATPIKLDNKSTDSYELALVRLTQQIETDQTRADQIKVEIRKLEQELQGIAGSGENEGRLNSAITLKNQLIQITEERARRQLEMEQQQKINTALAKSSDLSLAEAVLKLESADPQVLGENLDLIGELYGLNVEQAALLASLINMPTMSKQLLSVLIGTIDQKQLAIVRDLIRDRKQEQGQIENSELLTRINTVI